MMNRHIIQKQVVELSIGEMQDFHGLADTFTNITKCAASHLSTLFDKLADEHTTITTDYLEIDLGRLDWEKQQDIVGDRMVGLIMEKLSGLPEEKIVHHAQRMSVVPVAMRQWLAWKQYLQTGLMPWFGTQAASQQEWESILLQSLAEENDESIANFIHDVLINNEARNRLLLGFSLFFVESVMIATGDATAEKLALLQLRQWMEAEMHLAPGTMEKAAWNILLARLYDDNPAISIVLFIEQLICLYPQHNWLKILAGMSRPSALKTVFPQAMQKVTGDFIKALLLAADETEFRTAVRSVPRGTGLEPWFSSKAFEIISEQKTLAHTGKQLAGQLVPTDEVLLPVKINKEPVLIAEKEKTIDESLYIPYAGLVIVAPFLPLFFETTGLLDDKTFRDRSARVKAVRLVGFLANGRTDTPDWELIVPKILCGLDPADTIITEEDPDSESLQEATSLLDAMVKHWTALGRSSPDALRQGFLERDGKLTTDNQQPDVGWLLEVEGKTIDVLLQKIPWGFGTVKLPWMTKVLRTEWQGYL
jgi:hypothetical protein